MNRINLFIDSLTLSNIKKIDQEDALQKVTLTTYKIGKFCN